MPLSLGQIKVGAIVDWNIEWKKKGDGSNSREVESPRNPIRRGMIVQIEGDPQNEKVEKIFATFGEGVGKSRFEHNGVVMPCVEVQPRELNLVWDAADRRSREAWNRTFRVPEQIGATFETREHRAGKPKTVDSLGLTGTPSKGPIEDATQAAPLVVVDEESVVTEGAQETK